MKRTTNYSLPTWEKSDFIQMSDFNDLTQKTDAALKANADAAGGKADGAATSAALSALTKNLGTAGHNCRIAVGSYTGTDTYGSANPTSLTFDFYPVVVIVAIVSESPANNPSVFIRGRNLAASKPEGGAYSTLKLTWSDNGVSWYNANTGKNSAYQLNAATQYCYVVLGYEKPTAE